MNFVERILRTAWRLVLLLIVLAVLFPMVGGIVSAVTGDVLHGIGNTLGPALGSGVLGILAVVFLVGLGARLVRSVGDPAAAKRRQADRERLRRTARHRAEDVPAYGRARRMPPDEDPTLPFGDT
ncbi:MAG TPA: hypothetical protein VLT84_08150 [Acidobacteriota bacterium]|nr:hypothetical protein [Acidobacteriota bacterium]